MIYFNTIISLLIIIIIIIVFVFYLKNNKLNLEKFNDYYDYGHEINSCYDITEKKFYAKTKLNLWSWTENISLQINQLENEYKLSFLSICAMPTQIYDWGKNRRNFKKFIIEFKKL